MTTDLESSPTESTLAESAKAPSELAKAYDPKDVEPLWYAYWLEHKVFAASDDPGDTRPVYALPMTSEQNPVRTPESSATSVSQRSPSSLRSACQLCSRSGETPASA